MEASGLALEQAALHLETGRFATALRADVRGDDVTLALELAGVTVTSAAVVSSPGAAAVGEPDRSGIASRGAATAGSAEGAQRSGGVASAASKLMSDAGDDDEEEDEGKGEGKGGDHDEE